ncbi:MAG TPA: BTAD domain-containing putative transcriptional regulator [Actinomycetes bacterium]|jgi:predicted ATPase/DNA-binding SARP family transcriptional activator|nr:BTAD domain-containing putative transcriptional regulator [Actinomycetes bacterium]
MTIQLRLLSRVAYRDREITAPRLRGLLALLAGDQRRGAGAARLMDGLWPDEQPENPAKALQILVSRARAQLGADVIASTPTGYRLSLGEDQVDASAVLLLASASAEGSRVGDHAGALAHAEEGLALWEGAAGGDAGLDDLEDPVSALRAERASTYRSLVRARALALARLGRHAEAAEPLAELAGERPRDEEVLLELLRCEAATAGPSAALARYEAYRRSLRDELGTDPGPALQAMQQQLLQGTSPVVRHGVPHEPNPLLGRDGDIAAVTSLLRSSRVTSIVGPGGLGKTRLAQAVSRQAEQRVVHLVPLAGVAGDGEVAGEVAAAVGADESRRTPVGQLAGPPDLPAGIAAALGPGPALLVLDNCEHVLRGVAELVRALVSMTRDLRVLTTSRAPLGLSSESVYLLPELPLPTAVELFEQRARAARPGVELPAAVVEEVCRHLDGLPLAVELAAARVRVMSVAEIAAGLQDRFVLLRGGARDAPERHRTLQAVVDWSWNLLGEDPRAALRALSVFTGRFTAEAARRLLGDADLPHVLAVLEHLVEQSLLQVADTATGARFRMLETVRELSAARREAAGESDRAVDGLLSWARDFGVAHHAPPFGADPYVSLERIRAEQDNLAQALRYGLARADGATVAATAAVLGGLWMIESSFRRLVTLADETAVVLSHFRPPAALVEVTRTALTLCTGVTFILQGPHAARSLVALRRLPQAPPDTVVRAAGVVLGAVPEGLEALQELCDSDEPLVAAAANSIGSYLLESASDPDGALKAAERVLETLDKRGTPWMWGLAHCRVAELCLQLEQGAEARRHLMAALPVLERLGDRPDVIGIHWWMVLANLQHGDVDEAEHWLERTAPRRPDEPVGTLTYGLGARAEILLARGEVEAGLRLWRQVVDLLTNAEGPIFDLEMDRDRDPWVLEAEAVAVVAHAQHGRLDLVGEVAGKLPDRLSAMLTGQAPRNPYMVEPPLYGALLLALAMVDVERGARTGDRRAAGSAARMIALAERFRYLRLFQPTMSSAVARRAAEQADKPVYDDAVSSYTGLDDQELRAAALSALRERGQS